MTERRRFHCFVAWEFRIGTVMETALLSAAVKAVSATGTAQYTASLKPISVRTHIQTQCEGPHRKETRVSVGTNLRMGKSCWRRGRRCSQIRWRCPA